MASPYFVCSAATGAGTGASWLNACVSLTALQTAQAIAGGDIIYVHSSHNNLAGAGINIGFPETGAGKVQVICVDGGDVAFTNTGGGPGGGMGTTVGAMATGATENTNGNFSCILSTNSNLASNLVITGLKFQAGAGGNSSAADIILGGSPGVGLMVLNNCTLYTNSTNAGAVMTFGSTGTSVIEFNNCLFKFGATGQFIYTTVGKYVFRNCKVDSTTPPTTLLKSSNTTRLSSLDVFGSDLSACTNVMEITTTTPMRMFFSNCAIGTPTTGTHPGVTGPIAEFQGCAAVNDLGASSGANILAYYYEDAWGVVQEDTTVYLTTGGAQGEQDDGTDIPYSLMITPTTLCGLDAPIYTPWIYALCTTGSKTLTLAIAHTEAAALKTNEVWMEVEYMGEPGATGTTRLVNSPHTAREVDDDCPVIASGIERDTLAASGANRTDTSVAWTGITETETNTLTATVTCDEVGYIRCRVGLGKDTTSPVYVDPKIGGVS